MNLLRKIITSAWAINPTAASAYLPFVARLAQGEDVTFPTEGGTKPYLVSLGYWEDDDYEHELHVSDADSNEMKVAVYPLQGVILKEDGWCSVGIMSIMEDMRKNDAKENVIGHVLRIDSPGGEATYVETFSRFIRNEVKKPIHAHVCGMCGSAAYYIASACDKIYANEGNDIIGSIGAMSSWWDYKPMLEKEGAVYHMVVADQSDLKNKIWTDADKGDYEALKAKLLNPVAQQFITTVKEFRPSLVLAEAYRGQIYNAQEALTINMIDGFATERQVIGNLFTMQTNQMSAKTIAALSAVLGHDLESADGGIYLNAQQLAALEGAIAQPEDFTHQVQSLDNLNDRLQMVSEKLGAIEKQLQVVETEQGKIQGNLSNLQTQFDAWKKQPAEPPTAAFMASDPASVQMADALDAFEKKAALAAAM